MLLMLGPECEALADGPQRRGGWGVACMDPACFQHGSGQQKQQQKEEFLSFW
jgi:hypothetical protein